MCLLLSSQAWPWLPHRPLFPSNAFNNLKMARWVITVEPCFAELPETGNSGQNLCRGFLNLQLPGSPFPFSVFGHPTNPRPSSIAILGYLVPRHGHPQAHHRSLHVTPPSLPARHRYSLAVLPQAVWSPWIRSLVLRSQTPEPFGNAAAMHTWSQCTASRSSPMPQAFLHSRAYLEEKTREQLIAVPTSQSAR